MVSKAIFRVQSWIPSFTARFLTKNAQRTNRPNLAQPIDVNTLDTLISRSMTPSALAWPLLRFLPYLNARQTAAMLQKLPRLAALHQRRYQSPSWGGDQEQQKAYHVLMSSLAGRFAELIRDSSPTQMQQGLWGLSIWSSKSKNSLDKQVKSKIASSLNQRLQKLSMTSQLSHPLLSHAAWFMTASGSPSSPDTSSIAKLIIDYDSKFSSPASPSLPLSPSSSLKSYSKKNELMQGQLTYSQRMSRGGEGGPDGSLGREISLPHPASSLTEMDHRSILRLAWAFRSQEDAFAPAWNVVTRHATSSLNSLLKQHEQGGGRHSPLLPRKHYVYKTIREPQMRLSQPRPYRGSKYLVHSGLPRVSLVSFDLKSVASLVTSMAIAGHKDEQCLHSIERFVIASLPQSIGRSSAPSSEVPLNPSLDINQVTSPAPFRSTFDFSSSSIAPVLGGFSPPPLKPGSIEQGTAKPLISSTRVNKHVDESNIDLDTASRLLGSFYSLGLKSPDMAHAILSNLPLEPLKVKRLVEIGAVANKLGVKMVDQPMVRILSFLKNHSQDERDGDLLKAWDGMCTSADVKTV